MLADGFADSAAGAAAAGRRKNTVLPHEQPTLQKEN